MIAQPRTIREAIRATESILATPPPALKTKLRDSGHHGNTTTSEIMGERLDDTRKRLNVLRRLLAYLETDEAIKRASA